MTVLFLMDPPHLIDPEKDTTLALIRASIKQGDRVYFLPKDGISMYKNKLSFRVFPISLGASIPIQLGDGCDLSDRDVDVIWIRTDPPFDESYLHHTWILSQAKHIQVINNPEGIRTVNEKLWALQFSDLVPDTVVTRRRSVYRDAIQSYGTAIIKPTDGYGGSGIFKVSSNDPNINVIYEVLSQNGTKDLIIQAYLSAAKTGDKRILLLNGEPLGAILRVHGDLDHRNNFFAGGAPVACEITPRDQEIINVLAPHLSRLGLFFVGIDIIGDKLIEVNVTSPTCLQEMNRCYQTNLEDQVVKAVNHIHSSSR